jgi:hypothetical protein
VHRKYAVPASRAKVVGAMHSVATKDKLVKIQVAKALGAGIHHDNGKTMTKEINR